MRLTCFFVKISALLDTHFTNVLLLILLLSSADRGICGLFNRLGEGVHKMNSEIRTTE